MVVSSNCVKMSEKRFVCESEYQLLQAIKNGAVVASLAASVAPGAEVTAEQVTGLDGTDTDLQSSAVSIVKLCSS